jgi:hypothetical protein
MRAQCELCDCKIGEGWCRTCSDWLSRANTDAERQRRRYARKKAGLVRVEVFVPAHAEADVRAAIDRAARDAADDVAAVRPGRWSDGRRS